MKEGKWIDVITEIKCTTNASFIKVQEKLFKDGYIWNGTRVAEVLKFTDVPVWVQVWNDITITASTSRPFAPDLTITPNQFLSTK